MTEIIARIAGPYLIVTAVGLLVSRRFYERMVLGRATVDPVLLNLTGAAHFILGAVILANHWAWDGPGEAAVTLLGLVAAAKGARLIALPELTLKTPRTVGATLTASAVGYGLWGALLMGVGWGG